MALRIEPTGAPLGVFVYGLEVDKLTEAEIDRLRQAYLDHAVLVFRGQTMDEQQMLTLSELFGECGLHPIPALRHPEVEKLIILAGNKGEAVADDDPTADDRIGAIPWHTDLIYTEALNRGALLRAVKIPQEEGQTGWIDTARLYDQLSDEVKAKIADLRIIHSYAKTHSQQTMVGGPSNLFPDVIHPLVSTHPYSGRKILNISPSSAKEILGLPKEDARALLDDLVAHACREEEAYKHEWKADDVVLWDNWRTMHRAYGHLKRYPRLMHRTTLSEELRTGRWVEEPVAAE
jgi:taurine dioxygenase